MAVPSLSIVLRQGEFMAEATAPRSVSVFLSTLVVPTCREWAGRRRGRTGSQEGSRARLLIRAWSSYYTVCCFAASELEPSPVGIFREVRFCLG